MRMILQIIISNVILDLVTGILAKISLGTGIWAKFRLGTGIWYPPSRPSFKESSPAPAREVRRTVELAGKVPRIRRSPKQRDRFWPPIGHKNDQRQVFERVVEYYPRGSHARS